ncbi:autotransporter assembly complex protein TamA [Uliginosibacterium sp. H1]|uniref:autotransporter assembly complex protein TamA n=1 Tax=Uliginosibacterium sp. H1 TaxID=3114757 RepID=UPI002E19CBC5|nr:BamA/TamA family outer membrane protein [Uliginosibacterium sp. H1]
MRVPRLLLALALLGLTGLPAVAQERWRLQAPDEVAPLLRRFLPDPEVASEQPDRAARLFLARRLRSEATDLLATEGYFTPELNTDVDDGVVVLDVQPGRRTEVRSVEITFTGAIASDPAYAARMAALREAWALPAGRPFRQQDWTSAKERLLQELSAQDFAIASLRESVADIDTEASAAHLRLTVDSGPPFLLGPLQIEGLDRYETDLVQRYNPLRVGEPYSRERLLTLQSALQNTAYFSAVEIDLQPGADPAQPVPVRVRLTENKPRRGSLGVGYSSNTGARVEVGYRDADLFNKAWQLNSGVRVEQRRQSAFADVYFPRGEEGQRYGVGGLINNEKIEGLQIFKQQIGAVRSRTRGNIDQTIGLSYQREKSHPDGADEAVKTALALNWGWTHRKVDNLLDPRKGYVMQVQIGGGAQVLLSDGNFLRNYGRLHGWWPLSPRDVLLGRVEGGYTIAKTRDFVPEDFLFRTGGSQTVRGYDYLSLGVKEGTATVGGRYMAIGSVEYNHWFAPSWAGAVFMDAGNAADELEGFTVRYGYGLGARWKSPAGNIAFDVAYGQGGGQDESGVKAHISIAFAF